MQSLMARRARIVVGPDGNALTASDLPPAVNGSRWVIRRKATIVAAVRGGLLTVEEACERYALTLEEFLSWQSAVDRHGLKGLRTTKVQQYRTNNRSTANVQLSSTGTLNLLSSSGSGDAIGRRGSF